MKVICILRNILMGLFILFSAKSLAQDLYEKTKNSLTGEHVQLLSDWIGEKEVSKSLPILVLAGHADSQGISGSGTAGEAVDLRGLEPMNPLMRDELYWNIKICEELVRLGTINGLNISFYDPGVRQIVSEKDPRTNWSKGYRHSLNGGYTIEIHFDAYGKDGYGSGLIPAISSNLNKVDESLAKSFGRYPLLFRGGLGAPRRQIRILEIGKLEGTLENKLRDPSYRETTINAIALRIVNAILKGMNENNILN